MILALSHIAMKTNKKSGRTCSTLSIHYSYVQTPTRDRLQNSIKVFTISFDSIVHVRTDRGHPCIIPVSSLHYDTLS